MRRPDTRKVDLDVDERLGEGVFDIRRHRTDARGRADQLCEAAPRHKWQSEGWSTQARGGFEGGASTSTARWVRGGPWAWARSPEVRVRGAGSTLCGALRCEHEELVPVKVSVLHTFATFDRGCSHRKAIGQKWTIEWRRATVPRHRVRSHRGAHWGTAAPCALSPRAAAAPGRAEAFSPMYFSLQGR